jgi:YjbE family integral membrane protein
MGVFFSVDSAAFVALGQVILIDLVLAGDNAVVIGMAAARLSPQDRKKVIFWGLAAAVITRIAFAAIATQLLQIVGLALAGGVLLLWVSWRLYRELREAKEEKAGYEAITEDGHPAQAGNAPATLRRAIGHIALADLSMSLDNVLAVAGVALHHLWVLVVGLVLSIILMGVAATYIAKLLHRFPWISYAGLLMIVYVALNMIWHGADTVLKVL